MKLSEYTDEYLIEEIKHRGIVLEIHVSGVELDISLGGIDMGATMCTKMGGET